MTTDGRLLKPIQSAKSDQNMFATVSSREQNMQISCYSGTTFESLMRCSSTRSQDECRRQSARPTIRVAQESRVRERILASQSRQVGGVGNGTAGLWARRPSVWRTGGVGDPRRTHVPAPSVGRGSPDPARPPMLGAVLCTGPRRWARVSRPRPRRWARDS
jgi:hypothetical protein